MRWKGYWRTQTIIAHGSGSSECWKNRHERKTLDLTLTPLNLHWQILGRLSKLGRVSCSVNPSLGLTSIIFCNSKAIGIVLGIGTCMLTTVCVPPAWLLVCLFAWLLVCLFACLTKQLGTKFSSHLSLVLIYLKQTTLYKRRLWPLWMSGTATVCFWRKKFACVNNLYDFCSGARRNELRHHRVISWDSRILFVNY